MSTFDLSLVTGQTPQGDVRASAKYDVKPNPETGKPEEQKITESGMTIDKSTAPKLATSGPLGNFYTELLNQTLTVESMGAMVAAGEESIMAQGQTAAPTGKVTVSEQGASVDYTGSAGYIYITKSDDLSKTQAFQVAEQLLKVRNKNPQLRMGLGLVTANTPSESLESLVRVARAADVEVTTTHTGVLAMAHSMLGE